MSAASSFRLNRTSLRNSRAEGRALGTLLPRAGEDLPDVRASVQAVLDAVRAEGHAALERFAEQFDGGAPASVRVPSEEMDRALEQLDPAIRAGLEESIARARAFARAQLPAESLTEYAPGARVRAVHTPIHRVGLYVPGGLAVYPSSVIMNTVPAQVAGVESIALFSPPQKEFGGLSHPTILAAARLLGLTEVYAIGGAQAVAAAAYGVPAGDRPAAQPQIDAVDLITGPGNVYVATAKALVRDTVGIDAEAGPTEIAILADGSADPAFVAADLISQAEHDPRAAAVLITDSDTLADAVDAELALQVPATRHRERVAEALAGAQSGTVLVRDLQQGIAAANAYAAEHLEIHTRDADAVAARISHAGAVFVGGFSPVSLGDYCAGSNHVLPTMGTARYASGLNVLSFMKLVQFIEYDRAGLEAVSAHIIEVAASENLPAHGDAVAIRFRR